MLQFVVVNTSQIIIMLAVAGVITGAFRMPHAARPDLLASSILLLLGMAVREFPLHYCGISVWLAECQLIAVAGKAMQILALVLFVRGSVRDYCKWWVWPCVVAFVLALALLI